MILSKTSHTARGSTESPVSSRTSRQTPSFRDSPVSSAPPGRDHQPFSGSLPRCAIRMRSRWKMRAPTPTTGRLGYRRSLAGIEARAVNIGARGDEQRLQIGLAETAVGGAPVRFEEVKLLALRAVDVDPVTGHKQVALLV